ncbi:limbic system-associated membrane protein-like [Ptychodera flava]|uniref:limbic system-associated membrane protein-like n=1 Tax=Ptychodera flava TaxID=63121 RepID=UPI003969D4CD
MSRAYKCAVTMIVQPVNNTMEGDDVTIHCSSHEGYPDPYKIGLIFNSEEVIGVYGTEINHTIENILRSQSGTYECFAVTRFYDDSEQRSTAQYDIIVNYPATVTHVSKTEHQAEIGDIVVMKCAADGVPKPSITWYDGANDTIHERADDNLKVSAGGDGTVVNSSLTLTLENESYYGTYTCEAFNFNQSGDSQTFIVTQNKVTDDPVNLSLVLGVVAGVILVTLVSLVILYLVVIKKKHRSKVEDSPKDLPAEPHEPETARSQKRKRRKRRKRGGSKRAYDRPKTASPHAKYCRQEVSGFKPLQPVKITGNPIN